MEEEFNNVKYRFGRMNAMKQFHVLRRLAPLATRMGEVDFASLLGPPGEDGRPVLKSLLSQLGRFQPLADAFNKMPEEDCEYIINACLSVVTREQGPTFVPIWSSQAGRPMFDDIDMMLMINLTVRTLMENLSGFFPARAPE
jgi:hypothetical protein